MRSRCLLSINKIDDFIAYAKSKGHIIEPPIGDFEVFRIRKKSYPDMLGKPCPIYTRAKTARGNIPTHLTVFGDAYEVVMDFMKDKIWDKPNPTADK